MKINVKVLSSTVLLCFALGVFNSCDRNKSAKEENADIAQKVEAQVRVYKETIDSLNRKVDELEKIQSSDEVVNKNKDSLATDFKNLLKAYKRLVDGIKALDLSSQSVGNSIDSIATEGDVLLVKYHQYSKEKDRFEDLTERNSELYSTIKDKDDKFKEESEKWQKIAKGLQAQLKTVTDELNDLKNKYNTLLVSNALSQKEKDKIVADIADKDKTLKDIQAQLDMIIDVVPDIQSVRIFIKNEGLPTRVKKGNGYKASRIESVDVELHATAIKDAKTITVYIQYFIQPTIGSTQTLEGSNDKIVKLDGENIKYSRIAQINPGANQVEKFILEGYSSLKGEHRINVFYQKKEPIAKYNFSTF